MPHEPPASSVLRLARNVEAVRTRIDVAAARAGRPAGSARLVAVTKTIPAEVVAGLAALGVADVGENRIPEAEEKMDALGGEFRWHLVGHLQRNKARRAVGRFALIHSLDSERLLEHLDRIASENAGTVVKALVQVNVSGEDQKHGVEPDRVRDLLAAARGAANVEIRGLMGMAALEADPEAARPAFRLLARIRDDANAGGWYRTPLDELSMGMTNDFEVAVEEGATLVRIGTALFTGVEPTGGSEES